MKDAISGNCNEYSEGSPNLLETSEIVLLIVIIGTFKGNFVSFLPSCRVYLYAFTYAFERKVLFRCFRFCFEAKDIILGN